MEYKSSKMRDFPIGFNRMHNQQLFTDIGNKLQTASCLVSYIFHIDLILQSACCHRHLPDAPPPSKAIVANICFTYTSLLLRVYNAYILSSSFDLCIKRNASLHCCYPSEQDVIDPQKLHFFLPKFSELSISSFFFSSAKIISFLQCTSSKGFKNRKRF